MSVVVYLCGHGIMRFNSSTNKRTDSDFIVPPNVTIQFYCDHGDFMDNSWEAIIRGGGTPNYAADGQSSDGRKGRIRWEFKQGEPCVNYRLGCGDGLSLAVNRDDTYPWSKVLSGEKKLRDPGSYTVYIDDPALWLRLGDMIDVIRGQVGYTVKIHFNWFACREGADQTDKRTIYGTGEHSNKQMSGAPTFLTLKFSDTKG